MINNLAFWALVLLGGLVVFLLPTLIAVFRGADNIGQIFILNLLGAVTVGGTWVGALLFALLPKRPRSVSRPHRPVA